MFIDQFENLKPGAKVISNQTIFDDYEVQKGSKGIITEIDTWTYTDEPDILVFFYDIQDEVWCMYSELDLVKG